MSFKETFLKVKQWLQSLSFRTGVIVLLVLFGLAKTCQYGGLTILGVEGYRRLKNMLRKGKAQEEILKED